ncbi:Cof-type HAD-IIB family hydrolase [Pullulanibacillus sp. KACC 23026]|uniref:Cof-type HAD-IIB family hydrolase n=1 Tax=Pullulanibacillus sp. KACC 23026 TaxID=3028315 RepID=UPI0023AFC72C|nr:Cof-type HAD-IIB family hydrolase [Pullulanibacillus sp. KACC 23026]WEG11754.1 Cof-type HAD-IIB family hydrolase [Pullulanibacillus sp. KACC 23026]
MKPKIVFFDIDGTLLNQHKKLPVSAMKAVAKLQEAGIYTAIATGRAPFMHQHIRQELGIQSYLSYNGQYVRVGDKEIYKNPFKIQDMDHLLELAESHQHPLAYLGSEQMGANQKNHPFILTSFESLKHPAPAYHPHFYKENEIYQALLFFEKEDVPTYLDDHHVFDTIQWHEHSMDVIPKGGSKAKGIHAMLSYLGIAPEEAVAFGDGLNDIEMLKFVGHGIAMGNAVQAAKEAARDVTKPVDQDGIAFGLQKLGLIPAS